MDDGEWLLERAWLLGEDVLAGLRPGDEGKIAGLLGGDGPNPLLAAAGEDPHARVLSLMRDPEYFPFACRHLLGVEILPFQHAVLKELWTRTFPMLIGSRGASKSFTLAVFCILKALFKQGVRIVIVGAAFRQAKVVFEYVEKLWANAPILRDLCGGGRGLGGRSQGPTRGIDRCDCVIGDSLIVALPLGDGKKIRGQRANVIIADEFACLGADTLVETDAGILRISESETLMGGFRLNTGGGLEEPACFTRTPPADAYLVTLEGGLSFECSAIHSVVTAEGWKIASELTPEDVLPIPGDYEFPKGGVPEGDAWLMGLLAGGGSSTALGCSYGSHSSSAAARAAELMSAYGPAESGRSGRLYTASSSSPELLGRLAELGHSRQRVPSAVLSSSKEAVRAYLAGLFEGACRPQNGKVRLRTPHRLLASDAQYLLMKLGCFASLSRRKGAWVLAAGAGVASLLGVKSWGEAGRGPFRAVPNSLRVRSVKKLPGKRVLYDFGVPRAERFVANGAIQHNSIPPEIYEIVVKGFGAVSQDPVGSVKDSARQRALIALGKWTPEMDRAAGEYSGGNQAIISGSAYYSFNWFAKYWQRWRQIVHSRGDPKKLLEIDPDGKIDHRDYSVIRLPYEILPEGFMDKKTVASSRAMSHRSVSLMEYGSVFVSDSDGFFKRSLIESCVAGGPSGRHPFSFSAALRGQPGVSHYMGVDPASQSDNFAVVVVGLYPGHRRVVFCWTTRKKDFDRRREEGLTAEKNFFAFAARKVREVHKLFPCVRILIDAQGGGYQVMEALHDEDKLLPGESPLWEVIDQDPKKRKPSDSEKGEHVLEAVQFANADWVADANNGLKKDMEDGVLLFPFMDPALLGLSVEEDREFNRTFDTLEDAVMEVEALKDELATVQHSQTPAGRDRWDTPQTKTEGSKKGRMRKDRYSALLMANAGARRDQRSPQGKDWDGEPGWASAGKPPAAVPDGDGPLYVLGEGWIEQDHFS